MKAVVQRVAQAQVSVAGAVHSQIGRGLLVLLGVHRDDAPEDADWLARKIAGLRVFADERGLMNRSLADVEGEILLVSQFTLIASARKGNRPSFNDAAPPDHARALCDAVAARLAELAGKPTLCGVFGADMQVSLVNDGPVTIVFDTRHKE